MRVLLLSLATVWGATPLAAQQRAISDSDLFAFRWVASPQISPDGRQSAYVLVTVNAKHDGYETSLWVVGSDGASAPRRLTAGPRDGAPRWSPTARRSRSPVPRTPATTLPAAAGWWRGAAADGPSQGASAGVWSPDGKTIAFTSTTTPEDLAKQDTTGKAKSDVRIITLAEFRQTTKGTSTRRSTRTSGRCRPACRATSGQAHQVTSGAFDEEAPQWSRDGARIYFGSDRVRESYYNPPDNNVYSVPAAGGALDTVVDINGPAFGFALGPDGKSVAFRGWINPRAARSYNQSDLFVSRDGQAKNLTADYDFDLGSDVIGDQAPPRGGGASPTIWTADGKAVIVTTTEHGRSNLVRFDAQTGAREPLTTGEHAILAYTATPDAAGWSSRSATHPSRRPVRARHADETAHPAHPRERLAVRQAAARDAGGLLVLELRRPEDRDVDHEAGGFRGRQEVPPHPQYPRRPAHRLRLHLLPRNAADGRPGLRRGVSQPTAAPRTARNSATSSNTSIPVTITRISWWRWIP